MALKEYQAKRDFSRTQEPSARRGPPRPGALFVVQKHDATRLHYDFRLEMEGVLKSWAVPKGFPVRRGDRRLAVQVEDHPFDYKDFEGTIPEGNYGAGTVMVWDEGTYQVAHPEPIEALKEGKLHLTLQGKKLKGDWTLVRMRRLSDATKQQWLLLKSGEDARPWSAREENRSVLSGRSLEQIAGAKVKRKWRSNQTRRAGDRQSPGSGAVRSKPGAAAAGRGRSARRSGPKKGPKGAAKGRATLGLRTAEMRRLPAARPAFVVPMQALLVDRLPQGADWLYEIKFDGVRALALKNGEDVRLLSRNEKDLTAKYGVVSEEVSRLPVKQCVLDGEIVAIDAQGRSSFQLLQSYQSAPEREKPPLLYYVFDLLNLEGKGLADMPLWKRKDLAHQIIGEASPVLRFSAGIQAQAHRIIRAMQAKGLEGLIAKQKESTYQAGRRSGAWVKFKWTNEQEFVIGGYTEPKGGRMHFGALLVGYHEKGKLRFAAKVGTGFDAGLLSSLHQRFQKWVRPTCPFANLPEVAVPSSRGLGAAEMRRCTWLEPRLVCEVRFAEWTRDSHLRQPAFLGLREDKDPKEVVRESAG